MGGTDIILAILRDTCELWRYPVILRTLSGTRISLRDLFRGLLMNLFRIPRRISSGVLASGLPGLFFLDFFRSFTQDSIQKFPWIYSQYSFRGLCDVPGIFHGVSTEVPPGTSFRGFSNMFPEFLAGFLAMILPKLF